MTSAFDRVIRVIYRFDVTQPVNNSYKSNESYVFDGFVAVTNLFVDSAIRSLLKEKKEEEKRNNRMKY